MKYVLLLFFIVSCGNVQYKNETLNKRTEIDSELLPYVNDFAQYTEIKTPLKVTMVPSLPGLTVGRCLIHALGNIVTKRVIQIDQSEWQGLNPYAKKWLMFHELGHCILDRRHISELKEDNCPTSIMHPFLSNYCLEDNEEYYINELFNKGETNVYREQDFRCDYADYRCTSGY